MSNLSKTSVESLDVKIENPITQFNANCVRKKSNWSTMNNQYKMDHPEFKPEFFLKDMSSFSPKLVALLDKIKSLDDNDQKKHGKTFKHFIFSDIKSGGQGAKMLASAFKSIGWKMGYNSELKNRDKIYENEQKIVSEQKKIEPQWGPLELLSQNELLKTKKNNFYLLSSIPIFDKSINNRMKKDILSTFNSRPENIYGDLARIIIMDSGFKEGIDLFDIKYIHIFEPSMNAADQKQVIGRGTRTCGQKGLEFHPTRGWTLDIFIYDLEIPERLRFSLLGSKTAQELIMKAMNIDVRIATFGYDIERLAILGSVDYELNKKVHNFQVNLSDKIVSRHDKSSLRSSELSSLRPSEISSLRSSSLRSSSLLSSEISSNNPMKNIQLMFDNGVKFTFDEMTNYIQQNFSEYSWKDVKMENLCGDIPDTWKNFSFEDKDEDEESIKIKSLKRDTINNSYRSPLELLSSVISESQSSQPSSGSSISSKKSSESSSFKSSISSPISSKLSSVSSILSKPSLESSSELSFLKPSSILSEKDDLKPSSRLSQKDDLKLSSRLSEKDDLKPSSRLSQKDDLKLSSRLSEKISIIKDNIDNSYLSNEYESEDIKNKIDFIKEIVSKKKKGGTTVMKFTPTQEFIKSYFTPFAPVKGMLLYHSVGTGKTCSAIAAASTNFDPFEYTILWVTRTTLKSDIWKNMFEQVCNKSISDRIELGEKIPDIHKERMKLLSKAWRIRPLSYKQFSNLVSKKNQYYNQLVKENGEADPLQKTLLIIDEAHKLYGGSDLSSLERPDMSALHKALMNSYTVSGINSVRLLLMTATPITENPMELVKLLNLCKPIEQQMPDTFDLFSSQYLKEDGSFTNNGQLQFLDNNAGYISYLNREKDARQFSQPRIQQVLVPIVSESQMKYIEDFDKFVNRSESENTVLKLKEELEKVVKQLEDEIGDISKDDFKYFYDICTQYEKIPKSNCNIIINKNITALMNEIKGYIHPINEQIRKVKTELINLQKGQKSRLIMIKNKIQQNPILFEQYKSSTYASIRNNCSKNILEGTSFTETVKQLPEIIEIDNEIQTSKNNIIILNNQLKVNIETSKQQIKQLKESLKDPNIPPVEKTVIEYSIRNNQKVLNETKKRRTNEIQQQINSENKNIKKNEYNKKHFFITINKTLKIKEKIKRKEENDAENNKKQLKKTVNSIYGIKNEEIKLMANRREGLIKYDLEEIKEELLKKELEKFRKKEEKEEKEHNIQNKKTLKQREKAEHKENINLLKMREKEEKKREKQNNKTKKQNK